MHFFSPSRLHRQPQKTLKKLAVDFKEKSDNTTYLSFTFHISQRPIIIQIQNMKMNWKCKCIFQLFQHDLLDSCINYLIYFLTVVQYNLQWFPSLEKIAL